MGRDFDSGSIIAPLFGFNPRARMGRDFRSAWLMRSSSSFNPRARMGRDFPHDQGHERGHVSIHAPVWGATYRRLVGVPAFKFQSTRPYGARHVLDAQALTWNQFQSTRPYGARPAHSERP